MKKKGIIELPVQYLIAIVIFALVLSGISLAIYKTWKNYKIEEAEREVKKIIDEANLMAVQAEEGTRFVEINLSKEVNFVEIRDKFIKISMKWNENRILPSDVKLSCDEKIYSGKNLLKLELKKEEEKYVEIQVWE